MTAQCTRIESGLGALLLRPEAQQAVPETETIMTKTRIFGLMISLVVAAGCASGPSARNYSRNEARSAFDVDYGEVVDVRVITLEGEAGMIGTWGGASVGRAAGAVSSSRWNTRILASAVGGVAGAVAGRAIERKLREDEALEITVQLDGDDLIAVVQADDVAFEPGDRVRVLRSRDGSARVSAL
jgi:outer membrane lipoprotein SlyB